ncbi:hypothetical protein D3C75_893870 [compost metagenome]
MLRVIAVGEHAVAQGKGVVFVEVGEAPVDGQVLLCRLGCIDAHTQVVEEQRRGQCAYQVVGAAAFAGTGRYAVAQFLRTGQVSIAPGGVLALVAQLLQGIGLQVTCGAVVRLGEHQVPGELRHPAVVALAVRLARQCQHPLAAAQRRHIALACLAWRQGV